MLADCVRTFPIADFLQPKYFANKWGFFRRPLSITSSKVPSNPKSTLMTRTRRRFLEQVVSGAALSAAAPSLAYADRSAQAPSRSRRAAGRYDYLGRTPDYRDWAVVPRGLTVKSIETFRRESLALVRITASDGQDRMGTDRAVRGRHLRRSAAPADRAAGHRPRHQRDRRDQRRRDRRAVEVPLVVPLPRAGGRRYRALGSLRPDHRQARGGAARRIRAAAAGVRIEHAPRHQSRRRGGAAGAAPRPGSAARRSRSGSARPAAAIATRRPDAAKRSSRRCARPSARTSSSMPTRTAATRPTSRSRWGAGSKMPTTPRSRSRARTGSSSGRRK